jgi:hypothetical protein
MTINSRPDRLPRLLLLSFACASLCLLSPLSAETLSLTISAPASPGQPRYMGDGPGSSTPPPAAISPRYGTLGYDNQSLLRDGKPWLPIMGEFHFSRYPASEWRTELLKMKAGGITAIATYVFWIHHEEIQGQFDWSGNKNLHQFLQTCSDLDLPTIVRIGPWCHGEVRNGGMPDWADAMPRKRSTDPAFLAAVQPLYQQIAAQFKGELWKEGGPIMGIQVDNEFGGDPAYLLALKKMARDAGIDVPLYIKTGWPQMRRPVPFGELMPLFGAYAEGFWDRSLDSMPGNYWQAFNFSAQRMDTAIASDIFGQRQADAAQSSETLSYPYLCCELGGGMMSSYHRRIHIDPMDVLSVALVKIGSGSNMPGYYMYHGGTNPDALDPKTAGMMQESQSRNMWNDLPYKTYDFQAPLGEFGQVRESYHLLRRLHLFLQDYGANLARMPPTFPDLKPSKSNTTDLRYSVRSDGHSGFLFVNNYQRGLDMPVQFNKQVRINLPSHQSIDFPANGSCEIPANSAFIWPFNFDFGGATLRYASAQPLCRVQDGDTTVTFFVQTPGIDSDFDFDDSRIIIDEHDVAAHGQINSGRPFYILRAKPNATVLRSHTPDGRKQAIILLDEHRADQLYKATINGKEHVFFSGSNIVADGNTLMVSGVANDNFKLDAIPPLQITLNHHASPFPVLKASFTQTQSPGPLRTIRMGSQKVAEQPTNDDFAGNQPAVYSIQLPKELASLDPNTRFLLRLHYTGDVARLYAGDQLLEDNFYNGDPMDFGLWRLPPDTTELTLKILPLQKSAPIALPHNHWPDFQGKDSRATLDKLELLPEQTITVAAK